MKRLIVVAVFLHFVALSIAHTNYLGVTPKLPAHPRIMMDREKEAVIKKNIASDTLWARVHRDLIDECNEMLALPLPQRVLEGRRMLNVSKAVGRRLFFLSYAYRMTGEKKYAERAEQEMLAVSAFTDWNPQHFLDVAEMALGVAIGYDWLFDYLSPSSKEIIRATLVCKALEPAMKPHCWLTANGNWGQICNAGIAYGAVAVFEDFPAISASLINRAIETTKNPMKAYAPDGVYPEGYSYWSGGTDFNVLLLDLLECVFGQDYGLSEMPGFMKTPYFRMNLLGPNGIAFIWGDGSGFGSLSPAMFWFAKKTNDTNLLKDERNFLKAGRKQMYLRERLLPAVMVWGSGIRFNELANPQSLVWCGGGEVPILLMRSSWTDPDAVFVGFKGGSASAPHAHMDAGNFIVEAKGVRWATDLGNENYNTIESRGIDLWNQKQDGQRWKLFRYNNLAHNTLTVNGAFQLVNGYATLVSKSDNPRFMNAVIDMSSVYADQLKSAKRGVALVSQQYVVVRDEVENTEQASVLRWNMVTGANVKIVDENTAELLQYGKKLLLKVKGSAKLKMKTWSTKPATDFESSNQGKIFVGFEAELPANSKNSFSVFFLPEGTKESQRIATKNLESWR